MLSHIHQALDQVRELRARVLESQEFRGYSATARMLGALLALLAGFIMSSSLYPQTEAAHVFGWGTLCALAAGVNYISLFHWYRKQRNRHSKFSLRPVFDSLTPLFIGGVLTFGALLRGQTELLFGIWMCLFGLAHIIARQALPKSSWLLGWYYIVCGSLYLIQLPHATITNPWPMAVVFFIGELCGSIIFFQQQTRTTEISSATSSGQL